MASQAGAVASTAAGEVMTRYTMKGTEQILSNKPVNWRKGGPSNPVREANSESDDGTLSSMSIDPKEITK